MIYMSYNIAAGMDNTLLNTVISKVYSAVYPNLFKGSYAVNQMGFSTIDYDFNTAPTVGLTTAGNLVDAIEVAIKSDKKVKEANVKASDVRAIADAASQASLTLNCGLNLTINYLNGSTPTVTPATLQAVVNVQTSNAGGQNVITFQIVSGTAATVPPENILDQVLNNALVPYLIQELNSNLLGPIQVPMLQFESLQVTLPEIAVQSPNIVGYSNIGTTRPSIPAPASWPSNCIFAATDATALKAAASIPFPIGPSTGFNWDIVSGTVGATVNAPSNVIVNADGSIAATITADAVAQLTLHTPWPLPNVNFGPKATAAISATFQPSVQNGVVEVKLIGAPIPTFSFDWGIPGWINWVFDPIEAGLADALNEILGPLLSGVLNIPPIPVYKIPEINFTVEGIAFNISIGSATTSEMDSMLLISAQADIS